MKTFGRQAFAAAALWALAQGASALTFDVSSFTLSTVTTSGIDLSADPLLAPALPGAGTFTIAADPLVDPIETRNTYFAAGVGKFARYTFDLPADYSNLTFSFAAAVNDEYVLYLNGTPVAIQATTTSINFVEPLPGFSLDAAGTATDTSGKLEYLMASGMQSLFRSGSNELVLYGTDTLAFGGFAIVNGSINADTAPPIPEPSTYALMLAGLALVGAMSRRRAR